jgi:hypothetical protein
VADVPLFKHWHLRVDGRFYVALDCPPKREGEPGKVVIAHGRTLQEACDELECRTAKLMEIARAEAEVSRG